MSVRICYGHGDKTIDITDIVKKYLVKDGFIRIPSDDSIRAFIFGDPCFGIVKNVTIFDGTITKYNAVNAIFHPTNWPDSENILPYLKLYSLHEEIKFISGSMMEEYPEQILACKYIAPDANVLEIGANIGRNSCIISKLLNNSNQLVSMECSPLSAEILSVNKHINNLSFNIEVSALSKRRLVQRGWVTKPIENTEDVELGWNLINTVDWKTLKTKYNKTFDTLVLDCEGAFYWILMDEPLLLDDVRLIIVENDYQDILHKEYVDKELVKAGFSCVFSQKGGWGPCMDFFYQVWSKDVDFGVKIWYGVKGVLRDVTRLSFEKCKKDEYLFIPRSDLERSRIFGDHVFGQNKSVYVNGKEYKVGQDVVVNTSDKKIEYDKNLYLVDVNPGYNYGLCHQLWCVINAVIVGHHVGRDVMVRGFYPDYNVNKVVDLEEVVNLEETNQKLLGLGIRSKIVKYNKYLPWKETNYTNPVYLGPWQNMMGRNKFDVMCQVLNLEMDRFIDLYTCFVYPVFAAYGHDIMLCSFAVKAMNCLVAGGNIKNKIDRVLPSGKFHCVHLRLEDDWVNHVTGVLKSCIHFGKSVKEYSNQVFEQIVELIKVNMDDELPIYIASGLGKAKHVNNGYLKELQELFPGRILVNTDNFFKGRELNGYVDYGVACGAVKFIGGNLSSFSYSIRVLRLAEQKECLEYNG